MNTIRRTFIAGLMAIVAAAATTASAASEVWPYDEAGGLQAQVDWIMRSGYRGAPSECAWVFKGANAQRADVYVIHIVLRLMAQADACGELDAMARVAGRKGWYFEHAETGEIVPATAEWFKGLYWTYKEYYTDESNTADNG